MHRLTKLDVVLVGYGVALLTACAVVYLYQLLTEGPQAQASSEMYALGDLILFAGVCGFLTRAPTALALFWLRPLRKFWTMFSLAALGFALTGPVVEVVNTQSLFLVDCCQQILRAD